MVHRGETRDIRPVGWIASRVDQAQMAQAIPWRRQHVTDLILATPGQWYRDRESGAIFQVVGVDPEDRTIDLQYTDGSLEGATLEDWSARNLELCEQPEDWVGPFDDLEIDEIGSPEACAEEHGGEKPVERLLLELEARR